MSREVRPGVAHSGKALRRRCSTRYAQHAIRPIGRSGDVAARHGGCHRFWGADRAIDREMQPAACDYPMTMVQALRSRAASQANELAFVFLDHNCNVLDQTTFAALDASARSVGSKLTSRGLSGERIMIVFPSGLDFVAALFGCFYAVAVPTPYLIGKRAVERCAAIFKDSRPAVVLAPLQLGRDAEIRRAIGSNSVEWIHTDPADPLPGSGIRSRLAPWTLRCCNTHPARPASPGASCSAMPI